MSFSLRMNSGPSTIALMVTLPEVVPQVTVFPETVAGPETILNTGVGVGDDGNN